MKRSRRQVVNVPRCACGKPCWEGARTRYALVKCATCAELAIRADTIRRLIRSGGMAAMRRALAVCPDAQRTEPEPLRELTEAELGARTLLVEQANAERACLPNAEYPISPRRRGAALLPQNGLPGANGIWRSCPATVGLRYGKR
jgi:hypothetical protein